MSSPNGNRKKNAQLGMPAGTAMARLRKSVLFHLLQRHGENVCFHCQKVIETEKELSVEHKIAWLDNDPALFWDINNIAFSHLSCNMRAANHTKPRTSGCGSTTMYRRGCRCDDCRKANTEAERKRKQKYRRSLKAV